MSMYMQKTTCMNDGKILTKVLKTRFAEVEVHATPEQLIDFTGKPTHYLDAKGDKAEIIVRRKHVGGSANDIGFVKTTDGNYGAIISDFDRSTHGDKWLQDLTKDYLVEKAKSLMSAQDAEFLESVPTSDGGIRMTFRAPVYA